MSPTRAPLDADAVRAALAVAVRDVVPGGRLGRVEVVARTRSTSADLAAAATAGAADWPDLSVLVADHQEAGRGRAGRTWSTPPGAALTVSVLLRPRVPAERLGWVPLLGGLAVVRAVADVAGVRAVVKWPNDVLLPAGTPVDGWGAFRKVAGVLGDVVATPDGTAVVLGIGVNVDQKVDELPVPSASSLALAGAPADRVTLLAALVARWVELDAAWRAHDGDPQSSGLAERCAAVCSTIGRRVVVDLPGGQRLTGLASGLGPDGALLVEVGSRTVPVHAGDVRLRVPG